jgi:peptidoglycan/xylan/chitin deacetylase (PgdA/CDA1 family)
VSTQTNNHRLAILGFHKIGEPPAGYSRTPWYIPESEFVEHLRFLRSNQWHVLTLNECLSALSNWQLLPERSALLTFDDGYRSMIDIVLPWLRQFGFPSVVFVPTQFIGGTNDFDSGHQPTEAICGWDHLQQLNRYGCSAQSHGVSHRSFSWIDSAEKEQELLQSKAVLEANLGNPVEMFAYPYGRLGEEPSVASKRLNQVGYKAACLYGGGVNSLPVVDPYLLTRVAMEPGMDLSIVLQDGARPQAGRSNA